MDKFISLNQALSQVRTHAVACYVMSHRGGARVCRKIEERLKSIPTADVVARDCYERILAENDAMREQLASIGKKPRDRMNDVRPVVLCRDCKQYMGRPWENNESGICARTDCGVGEDDFCSYGEKLEES